MNPWNTECRIDFDEAHKKKILEFYNLVISKNKRERKEFLKTIELEAESKEYLAHLYNSGYGLKILARELGLTYSRFRSLFISYLGLTIRSGYNVVTDKVKEFRSERVKKEKILYQTKKIRK